EAIHIPGHRPVLRIHHGRPATAAEARTAAKLKGRYAAREMEVRYELAQLPGAAARLLPGLRSSEQMRRGGGQLGPIGLTARADSIQIVDTRHVHMPHVPAEIALVV